MRDTQKRVLFTAIQIPLLDDSRIGKGKVMTTTMVSTKFEFIVRVKREEKNL